MSSITKYYCDKCKKEVNDPKTFTTFDINFNPYGQNSEYECTGKNFSICPECLEKLGFKKKYKKMSEAEQPRTAAEMLYEIMSEMINENIR